MPRIKEYTSQVRAPGPTEVRYSPEDFGSPIGEGLRTLGQGVQSLTDAVKEHEYRLGMSDISAKMADFGANWTIALQERAKQAKPGDASFFKSAMDDLNKGYDQLESGISNDRVRLHFKQLQSTQRGHFLQQSFEIQQNLTGQKVIQDRVSRLNSAQQQVFNDTSDSSFNAVLAEYHATDDADSAILGQSKLAQIHASELPKIVTSRVQGDIYRDPSLALARLKASYYGPDLNGDLYDNLIKEADKAIERQRQKKEASNAAWHRAKLESQMATSSGLILEMMEAAKTGRPFDTNKIMLAALPDPKNGKKIPITGQMADALWDKYLAIQSRTHNKTDWSVLIRVLNDIDEDVITNFSQVPIGAGISWQDGQKIVLKHLNNETSPEGQALKADRKKTMKEIEQVINYPDGKGSQPDPDGPRIFADFRHWVDEYIVEARKGGFEKEIYRRDGPKSIWSQIPRRNMQDQMDARFRSMDENPQEPGLFVKPITSAPELARKREVIQAYNDILGKTRGKPGYGGNEYKPFGVNGKAPELIEPTVLEQAERVVANQFKEVDEQARQKAAQLEDENNRMRREEARKVEFQRKQQELRQRLSLPAVSAQAVTVPIGPEYRQSGESIRDNKRRAPINQ